MHDLPPGLDIESLPGLRRGTSPAVYFRDEAVASPSGEYFTLAYTIYEATMCNEVGHPLWGRIDDGRAHVISHIGVGACCWSRPWASWISEAAFAFKAQYYDGRKTHLPIVVINVHQGFAVVPGTNTLDSRPSDGHPTPRQFSAWSDADLLRAITAA